MSLAVLHSRALSGLDAPPVTVEVDLANGLPAFNIVGLPEAEVRESRERVRAALGNCGFEFPARRITVNLAPAELPTESGRFDLPITLGILAASRQIPSDQLDRYEFAGELSLTGELRRVRGALAIAFGAASSRRIFVLPKHSAGEASLVKGTGILEAASLLEVCAHLLGRQALLQPVAELPSHPDAVVDTWGNMVAVVGARLIRCSAIAEKFTDHFLIASILDWKCPQYPRNIYRAREAVTHPE